MSVSVSSLNCNMCFYVTEFYFWNCFLASDMTLFDCICNVLSDGNIIMNDEFGKYLERSACGLYQGTVLAFV